MKIRTAAAAALTLAAAALALAGCADGSGSQSMPGMDHGSSSSPSSSSTVTADFNDADVMFVQMMIPHHQQAIEMADMILNKEGIDPGVLTLASDIKAAQQPEIDQLQSWLDEWGADMPDMDSMEGMDHGGGMMSEDDMAALEAATGAEASRLFLEQMTMHHEGAIEMAQTIVDTQTAEIAQMQKLLAQL
jgi:uncharacterized protein (DUF305 family)